MAAAAIAALVIALVWWSSASSEAAIPLVINTWDFQPANREAWTELTARGGSAIDAVVAGCSTCERLQCDGTVGFGGSPDEDGETTLDAMIMDGRTMNVGAVAALRHIRDAIALARHVLDNTEHTLLVGSQATDFAEQMGFRRQTVATPASVALWSAWQSANCQPNFWRNVQPNAATACGPYEPLQANRVANGGGALPEGNRTEHGHGPQHHDTIGMIVIDGERNVAAGTSTNGARFKIPGRVGDSPIPGSGAYADNAVGAAAATGDGDILMRFLPSMLAVEFMRANVAPQVAASMVLERIRVHYPHFVGAVIAANRDGVYGAACHGMAQFPYAVSGAGTGTTVLESVECIA